ncbi:hypothetical protein PSI22_13685, partial [Xenorhabdus sp. XENO-7]|nr:hypothetical protein [Xenorhabdus aichiensis]
IEDLRREGASRLFEAGFSIKEVVQVTGHRSLNVLWQVYTELYPQSLHDKFNRLMQQKKIPPRPPKEKPEIVERWERKLLSL